MNDIKSKINDLFLNFTTANTPFISASSKIKTHYLEIRDCDFYCDIYFSEYDDVIRIEIYSNLEDWDSFYGAYHKEPSRQLYRDVVAIGFAPF